MFIYNIASLLQDHKLFLFERGGRRNLFANLGCSGVYIIQTFPTDDGKGNFKDERNCYSYETSTR